MVDKKEKSVPIEKEGEFPRCRLIWEDNTPIVECDSKSDVTLATKLINESGILIREAKVVVKVIKEESKE